MLSITGKNKVNTIDDFFHVGFTWDRHAEFMPRPIIISAMELCTAEVVEFLLTFGADLSKQHEGKYLCARRNIRTCISQTINYDC